MFRWCWQKCQQWSFLLSLDFVNGLQVNGSVIPRVKSSTKSSMFHDFEDVLKDPFRYLHLFLDYHQNIFKNRHAWLVTEGPKLRYNYPPIERRSGPYKSCFFPTSSTYQKHLNLGQCLETDDRRSLSKFGDVTWPSSHFTDRSVFYRPAFYRLACKIVNL